MVHVSKKKLDSELLEKLFDQLVGVMVVAANKKSLQALSNELFTKTEKVMFAKRLAAILLLNKGMPQHIISEKLNMSPSTIAKLSLGVEMRRYDDILGLTESKGEKILESILGALLENLPYPFGRRRSLQSMYKDSQVYKPRKKSL